MSAARLWRVVTRERARRCRPSRTVLGEFSRAKIVGGTPREYSSRTVPAWASVTKVVTTIPVIRGLAQFGYPGGVVRGIRFTALLCAIFNVIARTPESQRAQYGASLASADLVRTAGCAPLLCRYPPHARRSDGVQPVDRTVRRPSRSRHKHHRRALPPRTRTESVGQSAAFATEGGIQHIHANEKALEGYDTGKFDG